MGQQLDPFNKSMYGCLESAGSRSRWKESHKTNNLVLHVDDMIVSGKDEENIKKVVYELHNK